MSSPTQNPPQQQAQQQPPLAPPPSYPPSETGFVYPEPPQRRRVWPWVLGSVLATVLLLVVAGAGALFWVASQQPGVSDARLVYEEHFTDGAGRFPEFTQAQTGTHAARAHDGAYEVTSPSLQSSSTATATVAPADVVDVSGVTTLTKGTAQGAGTGLIVARGTSSGWLFEVVPMVGARLAEVSGDQVLEVATEPVPVVAATARLRLTVEHGIEGTSLAGYLDGREVVSALVTDDGPGGFDEVGVALYTGTAPAAMTVDDVVVRTAGVTGSG